MRHTKQLRQAMYDADFDATANEPRTYDNGDERIVIHPSLDIVAHFAADGTQRVRTFAAEIEFLKEYAASAYKHGLRRTSRSARGAAR